jgi:prepilin-type N-terminal cleavage/methylation domain-containing protein
MHRRVRNPPQSRRGFSLVELAFVTVIIAITCAIVLPHWSGSIQNYQLTLAARRVASDLAWAQASANGNSASVTVTFDVTGGTYQLSGVSDPDHTGQNYTVDLTADPYRVTLASASFGNATSITFNGYGIPGQGGSVVVSSGTVQRTVSLDAATGQITIQ